MGPKLSLKFRDSFGLVLYTEALLHDQQSGEYLLLTLETNYGAFESLSLAVAPWYSATAAAKLHSFYASCSKAISGNDAEE